MVRGLLEKLPFSGEQGFWGRSVDRNVNLLILKYIINNIGAFLQRGGSGAPRIGNTDKMA